jgi:hypothetical protein
VSPLTLRQRLMSDTDDTDDNESMDLEDPYDVDLGDDVLPTPDGYGIRRALEHTNFQYRADALRFYDRTIAANLFNVAEYLMKIAVDFFNFAVATFAAAQQGVTLLSEAVRNVAIVAAAVASFFRNEFMLYYNFMDLVYYQLQNRGPPPEHERFHPKVHTTIDEFSEDDSYNFTGFDKERVRQLKRALRLHDEIPVVGRRTRFDGEELLLICITSFEKKCHNSNLSVISSARSSRSVHDSSG